MTAANFTQHGSKQRACFARAGGGVGCGAGNFCRAKINTEEEKQKESVWGAAGPVWGEESRAWRRGCVPATALGLGAAEPLQGHGRS